MSDWIKRIKDSITRWEKFVSQDIWTIGTPGEEIPRGFFIQQIRVFILLGTKIFGGTLMLRAAALTFATLLSIVPFFAIIAFVIQTFNLGERFYGNMQPFLEEKILVVAEKIPDFGGKDDSTEESGNRPEGAESDSGADNLEPNPEPLDEVKDPIEEDASSDSEDRKIDELDPSAEPVDAEPAVSDVDDNDAEIMKDSIQILLGRLTESDEEGMEDPAEWLSGIADNIENLASDAASNKAALGVSAFVLVLTTVFGLMRNVEKTFNHIWGVRPTRTWYRAASNYFMVTLLLPFVMTATLAITGALQSERITQEIGSLAIVVDSGKLVITALALALLYTIIPSTKVKRRYAIIGGLAAAVLWILVTELYFSSNRALVRHQAVLSAFAQFPMILMWIYFSWAIFILGAEVTYAYQNEKTFAMERFAERASYAYREALGVRAMLEIGKRFQDSMDPFIVEHAAGRWNVPSRLLNEVLFEMDEAGLVIMAGTDPVTYQPGRPLDKIHLNEVQDVLKNVGEDPSLLLDDEDYRPFFKDLYEKPDYEKNTVSEVLTHLNPVESTADEPEAG